VTNEKIELLLKEYEDRREENAWHTQRYHKQSNFTYLYASAIIAISGVLSSNQEIVNKMTALHISGESLTWFYLVLLSLAAMIGYYLFASTLDALFMLYVNGIRAGVIERLINAEAKQDILIWNSKILKYFFDSQFVRIRSWVKPPVLVIAWIFLFFLATNGLLCFLCYLMARDFFFPFSFAVTVLTFFHLYQLFALNNIGAAHIWSYVTRISGLQENSPAVIDNASSTHESLGHSQHQNILVALGTISLGFLPMALLSIQTGSFLPSSGYSFPFLLNISSCVGDLLLLPIFNSMVYRLLSNNWSVLKTKSAFKLIIILSTLLGGSSYVQFIIHKAWISDQYTGYMDLTLGQLSFAGWWHFAFASVETTVVLLFLLLWYQSRRDKNSFAIALSAWKYFCIYVSIGALDFIVQLFTAFKNLPLSEILPLQLQLALRIALVLTVYLFSSKYFKKLA
jgi:hypothetical protein